MIGLVLQLVLYYQVAHHIAASDLGYYFLASAFIFIPAGIMDFGFVSSVIQKKEVSDEDFAAVFRLHRLSLLVYIPIALIVVFLLSSLYEYPKLFAYFICLSPFLLAWIYISIQAVAIKRALNTKRFALIEVCGIIILFVTSIVLLYAGYGVMSLIAGQLVKALTMAVGYATYEGRQSISVPVSAEAKAYHWNFGKYIIGEKVFGIGLSYIDIFLVNHFLGPQVLGVYELLKRMIIRPVVAAYIAIEQVTFPLLSKAVGLTNKFSEAFKGIIRFNYLFFLILPLVFISNFLLSFLPATFQQEQDLFQWLILLALAIIIHNPVDIVSYSLGRTKAYYSWVWKYGIMQIIVLIFAVQYGIIVLIQATIIFNLIVYVLSYWILKFRETQVSFVTWIQPVMIYAVVACIIILLC